VISPAANPSGWRVPRERDQFAREITESSEILRQAGAATPADFCYASGSFLPQLVRMRYPPPPVR